ncbi:Uncharacterised protein [Nocardia asteroides]|nr:hypothetical protein SAMN05444423_10782 [Nocardia asteroides]VEG37163.1 Uncharacterised protein [Nocardia asteroides]
MGCDDRRGCHQCRRRRTGSGYGADGCVGARHQHERRGVAALCREAGSSMAHAHPRCSRTARTQRHSPSSPESNGVVRTMADRSAREHDYRTRRRRRPFPRWCHCPGLSVAADRRPGPHFTRGSGAACRWALDPGRHDPVARPPDHYSHEPAPQTHAGTRTRSECGAQRLDDAGSPPLPQQSGADAAFSGNAERGPGGCTLSGRCRPRRHVPPPTPNRSRRPPPSGHRTAQRGPLWSPRSRRTAGQDCRDGGRNRHSLGRRAGCRPLSDTSWQVV